MTAIEQSFQEHYWDSWDQVETFRHQAALDLVRIGPVLDIGAGDGFFLGKLKEKKGIQGTGIDLSHEASTKAAKKRLDVRVTDVTGGKLPFADGSFATVVMLDVIEHLFRPLELILEAKRLAHDEIIISVPNFSSLPARWQTLRGRVPENSKPRKGHVYWFTWKEFHRLLAEAGLRVEETRLNANFKRLPFIGDVFQFLAERWPSLFALSFVVRARKV